VIRAQPGVIEKYSGHFLQHQSVQVVTGPATVGQSSADGFESAVAEFVSLPGYGSFMDAE
jgi:hypothetical protein